MPRHPEQPHDFDDREMVRRHHSADLLIGVLHLHAQYLFSRSNLDGWVHDGASLELDRTGSAPLAAELSGTVPRIGHTRNAGHDTVVSPRRTAMASISMSTSTASSTPTVVRAGFRSGQNSW